MKYVVNLPIAGPLAAPRSLSALARTAEAQGVDVISSSERLILPRSVETRYPYGATGKFPGGTGGQKSLEMLMTLAFLCGQTSRVRILTSVLVLPYRDPILAAKMLATLDVLSQGRLIVGCGVGWMREEFEALGLPVRFEDRGRASDEYLRGMQELWCSENPEFKGNHVRFSGIEFHPQPVQRPHPPFWFGGESPAALRRVARFGDGWMPIAGNPRHPLDDDRQLTRAIERLRRMVEAEGRDPDKIHVRFGGGWNESPRPGPGGERLPMSGTVRQVAGDIRRYQDLGVDHLGVGLLTDDLSESLERIERFMTSVVPLV